MLFVESMYNLRGLFQKVNSQRHQNNEEKLEKHNFFFFFDK